MVFKKATMGIPWTTFSPAAYNDLRLLYLPIVHIHTYHLHARSTNMVWPVVFTTCRTGAYYDMIHTQRAVTGQKTYQKIKLSFYDFTSIKVLVFTSLPPRRHSLSFSQHSTAAVAVPSYMFLLLLLPELPWCPPGCPVLPPVPWKKSD